MDMPDSCERCEMCKNNRNINDDDPIKWCLIQGLGRPLREENKRASWCPLKEMPEDDENEECYFPNEYRNGYARGWNECIRKITE